MKLFYKMKFSSIWMYRLVRWAFGALFIAIGFFYEDAWSAYIFGALFIATSFYKRPRCLDNNCSITNVNRNLIEGEKRENCSTASDSCSA